ncbi:unnamed protein product [Closterium sp. NIES-54]
MKKLVRYNAHQLNLWPRVSLPETSPTLRWTGRVGDASVFRDVNFDESVPFYHLFPYRSAPPPPPPLFLAPGPPRVDPLPPQGPAPSGVSQVEPLPGIAPIEVAVGSCAAPGASSGGAASGGAGPGGVEPRGVGSEGVGSGGAEPGGAEPAGVESGGAEPESVEPGGPASEGAESEGAKPMGIASSGGPAGAPPQLSHRLELLSPKQLREWFAQRTRLQSGAARAGVSAGGDTGDGGAGVTAGAGGTGAGAGDPTEPGAAGAGVAQGLGAGTGGTGIGGARAGGAGAVDPGAGGAGSTLRPQPYLLPLLQQVLGVSSSLDQSQPPFQVASPLPAPSPYTQQIGGLTERREPASRPTSPVRTSRRVPRPRPRPVPGTHAMALRPSSVPLHVPLPPPHESSLAASPTVSRLLTTVVNDPSFEFTAAFALVAELVDFAAACRLDYATALFAEFESASPPSVEAMDAEMASWKSTSTYVDAVPPSRKNIVIGMWIFRVKRPPGSPPAFKACYVARGFSQRHGVDYFHNFSPTPNMTTLQVLLHVAAQHDYELHSLDFSTAFLQGSLHEEIWLRRPPGFTGSFPAGNPWSLRRPIYGLRQAPREWHDTLRTTLAALGFSPTSDPSLFLRTDTSLSPFYVLVYVDDLVFAIADIEAFILVKSELQKRHACIDLGELRSYLGLQITRDTARRTITLTQSHVVHEVLQRFGFQFSSPQPTPLSTGHSLSAPPLDESVDPSGPYPELVGCLMYLITCTQPDLAYPLSLLARYVAPGRHRKVHWDAAKRGTALLVQYRSTRSSSVLNFSCEAEIYAGAMAAQELRWLTYLLTDLGEQTRSPPVLYVDNKAMIALCQEHKLEHRTKQIALRYFLARELQQHGHLRLAYVATLLFLTGLFYTWLDDLQVYLLSESRDIVSLFDHTSGAASAPPATTNSATCSQWLTRDTASRLAIRNHLPLADCAHFGQHMTAQALYDAVVARYSSLATATLGHLQLPLFPELSAFATVEDLVSHLHTSDARYRTPLLAKFLDRNQPPMFITLYLIVTCLPESLRFVRDHFIALDPTVLTVDLLEQHLLAPETSVVDVGAARGTLRTPFFEGFPPPPLPPPTPLVLLLTSLVLRTSRLLLLMGSTVAARARVVGVVAVAAGVVVGAEVEVVEAVEVVAIVGVVAGVGALVAAVVAAVGVVVVVAVRVVAVGLELLSVEILAVARGSSSSVGVRPHRPNSFVSGFLSVGHLRVVVAARMSFARVTVLVRHAGSLNRCFSHLDDAWRAEFGDEAERPRWEELLRSGVAIFDLDYDAILVAMYALSVSVECGWYLYVPPNLGIEAPALGASESSLPGTAPAEALHTFKLDSCASRCFFRDSTTLTPLSATVPVGLADPSGGPVLARSSTVLPCPTVPSGSLLGLHLPLFSTNLVSTAALQDAMVTTTTPGGQRVSICTCTRTGRHLATFTRRPKWSLYTLATEPSDSCFCPGVRVRSGSTPWLVSPPVAPDSLVAPPPWSPLPATPLLHALSPHCLWSFQVSASPPPPAPPCLPVVPKYYSSTVIALPFNLQACSASGILWGGA